MNVCGSHNNTRPSSRSARATRALNFFSSVQFAFQRSASFCTSRNPALCRVFAYSAPGFPRPTMRNIFSSEPLFKNVFRGPYRVKNLFTQHGGRPQGPRNTSQITSSSRRQARRLSCRQPERRGFVAGGRFGSALRGSCACGSAFFAFLLLFDHLDVAGSSSAFDRQQALLQRAARPRRRPGYSCRRGFPRPQAP